MLEFQIQHLFYSGISHPSRPMHPKKTTPWKNTWDFWVRKNFAIWSCETLADWLDLSFVSIELEVSTSFLFEARSSEAWLKHLMEFRMVYIIYKPIKTNMVGWTCYFWLEKEKHLVYNSWIFWVSCYLSGVFNVYKWFHVYIYTYIIYYKHIFLYPYGHIWVIIQCE